MEYNERYKNFSVRARNDIAKTTIKVAFAQGSDQSIMFPRGGRANRKYHDTTTSRHLAEYVYNKGGGAGGTARKINKAGGEHQNIPLPAPDHPAPGRGRHLVSRGNPPHIWQTPSLISPLRPGAQVWINTPIVSLEIGSLMRSAFYCPPSAICILL